MHPALAKDLRLLIAWSSDSHRTRKPRGLGAETTSWTAFEQILTRSRGTDPIPG